MQNRFDCPRESNKKKDFLLNLVDNMTHPHRFGFGITTLSIQISKVKEQTKRYLKTHVYQTIRK